ncbi:hypothetical protein STEG23_021873, partial [Scotinomys teguina]
MRSGRTFLKLKGLHPELDSKPASPYSEKREPPNCPTESFGVTSALLLYLDWVTKCEKKRVNNLNESQNSASNTALHSGTKLG